MTYTAVTSRLVEHERVAELEREHRFVDGDRRDARV
jgi:hypothetical protein